VRQIYFYTMLSSSGSNEFTRRYVMVQVLLTPRLHLVGLPSTKFILWLDPRAWHSEGTLGSALYSDLHQVDGALGRCVSI